MLFERSLQSDGAEITEYDTHLNEAALFLSLKSSIIGLVIGIGKLSFRKTLSSNKHYFVSFLRSTRDPIKAPLRPHYGLWTASCRLILRNIRVSPQRTLPVCFQSDWCVCVCSALILQALYLYRSLTDYDMSGRHLGLYAGINTILATYGHCTFPTNGCVTAHCPVGWNILVSSYAKLVQWLSLCY